MSSRSGYSEPIWLRVRALRDYNSGGAAFSIRVPYRFLRRRLRACRMASPTPLADACDEMAGYNDVGGLLVFAAFLRDRIFEGKGNLFDCTSLLLDIAEH